MAKVLTPDQAAQAIYFDFEGCPNQAPSLLGWSYLRPDGTEHFRQRIVERELWPACGVTVPHTGGAQQCDKRTLDNAVRRMCELAEEGDRLLVSWSEHDLRMVEGHVGKEEVKARVRARYRNALPTARQWLSIVHPEIQLQREGYGGKHALAAYAQIMDIRIPQKYGVSVAASGIKAMRAALAVHGKYRLAPKAAQLAWAALLGHNRLDCKVAREIITRAAAELALAKGSP